MDGKNSNSGIIVFGQSIQKTFAGSFLAPALIPAEARRPVTNYPEHWLTSRHSNSSPNIAVLHILQSLRQPDCVTDPQSTADLCDCMYGSHINLMASPRTSLAPCRACRPDEAFCENSSKAEPCCDRMPVAIHGQTLRWLILQ